MNLPDLPALLSVAGYAGILAIVFAETGLLLGFFLPGDSLLITAGIVAAQGSLDVRGVMAAVIVGAILGDTTGYLIGRRFGPAVFRQQDSRLLRPEFLTRTQEVFGRYGRLAVVVARFIPVVRTMTPTLAGVGRLPYPVFLGFSVLGAVLWGVGVPLAGYWLGGLIPHLDRYILLLVAGVLLVSAVPVALGWRRARRPG
ncbi:membrane protein [Deinococcus aetherius]|uniref:Membrane protein n=1 Tax=Deinococcus aetherius TaxID=200252 RepID=A0ABM8A911_9DEIO|nr:DedA family protein [Deinococcus aetherius]BDP40197.1 membrane protein [Deinococcus aetherius]